MWFALHGCFIYFKILKALKKETTDAESVALINTLRTDDFHHFKMKCNELIRPWKMRMEIHTYDMEMVTALPPVKVSERKRTKHKQQA
jgi:hypothetical protein